MRRKSLAELSDRGVYGILIAVVYALINQMWSWPELLAAALVGFLIGLFTNILDEWFFATSLRRQQFLVVLAVRTITYLVVISLALAMVIGPYLVLFKEVPFSRLISGPSGLVDQMAYLKVVGYSLGLLVIYQYFTLIARLLGPNVLINYVLGRYHQPKEEERIFMFMDLRSSTTIAEKLGHFQWHKFLNDFFFDIAGPVHRYKGEIYQYVGDEVVVSWPKEIGLENMNCVRCFFGIWDRMEIKNRRARYQQKYGFTPIFKAGFHVGKVVVGEIGDYKRDIVFHGDTVNTASRIQLECNRRNRRLLMSSTLLDQLDLQGQYTKEFIASIRLRGKEEELSLYSLDPLA